MDMKENKDQDIFKESNYGEEKEPVLECFEKHQHHSLRILLEVYKGNYSKMLLSALFFAIKHTPAWALPIAIAGIVDTATYPERYDVSRIWIYVFIMFILIVQNVPSNYVYTKLYSKAIRRVEASLRGSLIRKLQQLSITYHKDIQSGRLQSKIMRDVEAIETMSTQVFTSILAIAINIIVAFIVTITKSMLVFSFFVITIPVAVITIILFRTKIRERNTEFRKEMEETSAKVMEMVEMIPVTRAYSVEEKEINRLEKQINQVALKGYHLDMVQSFFGSISWVVFQLFQILCLAFTGYLAYKGKISVGDIVLYQTYFSTIVNNISQVTNLLPIFTKGMESIDSIGDILTAHDVESNKGKKKIKNLQGAFQFEDVVYSYGKDEKNVLNNFGLTVNQGETVAFVGGSGAGKTTIMNLLIGFLKPTSGAIYVDGEDITKVDMHSLRLQMAVVPQDSILFSDTLRNNITYGLDNVSDDTLRDVLSKTSLLDMVNEMPQGLDTMIGEHGGKLSGGQRQRISIARALIRNPKVIILDEATSALDSISETKIQQAIDILTKDKTTFVVAHRLSTIKNADRIVVLKDGVVEECGTYDELMANKGEFYKMKELQG
jgi:ATP-binding cassette subfamily B protein